MPGTLRDVTTPKRSLWAWTIGTFFGAGFGKPGPGTYGSVAAVLLWYGTLHLVPLASGPRAAATLFAALVVTLIGIPAATIVARQYGRKDPSIVVVDEVAGQLFALTLMRPDWQHAVLALVLFRLFDITKPWPIRHLEALPEGTGIMLDDVAAGLLAMLVGLLLQQLPLHL
jgi:phosphatidylglycerophosphatase A